MTLDLIQNSSETLLVEVFATNALNLLKNENQFQPSQYEGYIAALFSVIINKRSQKELNEDKETQILNDQLLSLNLEYNIWKLIQRFSQRKSAQEISELEMTQIALEWIQNCIVSKSGKNIVPKFLSFRSKTIQKYKSNPEIYENVIDITPDSFDRNIDDIDINEDNVFFGNLIDLMKKGDYKYAQEIANERNMGWIAICIDNFSNFVKNFSSTARENLRFLSSTNEKFNGKENDFFSIVTGNVLKMVDQSEDIEESLWLLLISRLYHLSNSLSSSKKFPQQYSYENIFSFIASKFSLFENKESMILFSILKDILNYQVINIDRFIKDPSYRPILMNINRTLIHLSMHFSTTDILKEYTNELLETYVNSLNLPAYQLSQLIYCCLLSEETRLDYIAQIFIDVSLENFENFVVQTANTDFDISKILMRSIEKAMNFKIDHLINDEYIIQVTNMVAKMYETIKDFDLNLAVFLYLHLLENGLYESAFKSLTLIEKTLEKVSNVEYFSISSNIEYNSDQSLNIYMIYHILKKIISTKISYDLSIKINFPAYSDEQLELENSIQTNLDSIHVMVSNALETIKEFIKCFQVDKTFNYPNISLKKLEFVIKKAIFLFVEAGNFLTTQYKIGDMTRIIENLVDGSSDQLLAFLSLSDRKKLFLELEKSYIILNPDIAY